MTVLQDPLGTDRGLRDAARDWVAWQRALRRGEGADHRFDEVGKFASRQLVLELRDEAAARDPLAPQLLRWAYRLHLEHASRAWSLAREQAWRVERHPMDAPVSGRLTLRELLGELLANTRGTRSAFLGALLARSSGVADREQRLVERRAELAGELGLESEALELPGPAVVVAARTWLEGGGQALATLGARDLPSLIEVGLGRETVASWPARLEARSLAGLLDEAGWLRHASFELEELPRALGSSSFLRGLARFGAGLRGALAPKTLPFVVAHEPYDLAGETLGALLLLLPFGESFARRKLDVGRERISEHRRSLARVLCVGAGMAALRVTLREPTRAGKAALSRVYPELTWLALGVELPESAAGVLVRSRPADPQRFAALLLAADLDERLRQAHDDDWYRNPRAVEEVLEAARLPPVAEASEEALAGGARILRSRIDAAL